MAIGAAVLVAEAAEAVEAVELGGLMEELVPGDVLEVGESLAQRMTNYGNGLYDWLAGDEGVVEHLNPRTREYERFIRDPAGNGNYLRRDEVSLLQRWMGRAYPAVKNVKAAATTSSVLYGYYRLMKKTLENNKHKKINEISLADINLAKAELNKEKGVLDHIIQIAGSKDPIKVSKQLLTGAMTDSNPRSGARQLAALKHKAAIYFKKSTLEEYNVDINDFKDPSDFVESLLLEAPIKNNYAKLLNFIAKGFHVNQMVEYLDKRHPGLIQRYIRAGKIKHGIDPGDGGDGGVEPDVEGDAGDDKGVAPADLGGGGGGGGVGVNTAGQVGGGDDKERDEGDFQRKEKDADKINYKDDFHQKTTQHVHRLAPFLSTGGVDIFDDLESDESDKLKQENLMMGQYKPPNWPLGNIDNPLWLGNMKNKAMRWGGELETMPMKFKGGSLTEGAKLYGSYSSGPQGNDYFSSFIHKTGCYK